AMKNYLGSDSGPAAVMRAVVDGSLIPAGYTNRFRGITGYVFLSENLRKWFFEAVVCRGCPTIRGALRGDIGPRQVARSQILSRSSSSESSSPRVGISIPLQSPTREGTGLESNLPQQRCAVANAAWAFSLGARLCGDGWVS